MHRTNLRRQCQLRESEPHARRQNGLRVYRLASPRHNVLPSLGYSFEAHEIAFAARVFDHHHCIRVCRDCGAGHDLQTGSRCQPFPNRVASFDFSHALEICAGRCLVRAHRVPIARRAVKWRIFPIRPNFLRQYQSQRVPHVHDRGGAWPFSLPYLFDYLPACFLKGEHFR